MKVRGVFLPLLLLVAAVAQDTAPIVLSGKGAPPICRGRDSDSPDCVNAPHAIYSPDPDYPDKERKARHKGTVLVDLVVGVDGLPRDLKISRTLSKDFDRAAMDAVKKWKFSPATKGGNPVAAEIMVEVTFNLY